MDKAEYHKQNKEFMKDMIAKQRSTLYKSHAQSPLPVSPMKTQSEFLDPKFVLKHFKKLNFDNEQKKTKAKSPFPTVSAFIDEINKKKTKRGARSPDQENLRYGGAEPGDSSLSVDNN